DVGCWMLDVGCWMSSILPSVCAEERRAGRIRARDCLSEASLSETPPRPSTAGYPEAQRRGRRQRGRPFFGYFLSAKRKKVTAPPGAHPGLRPRQRARPLLPPRPSLKQ